MPEAGLPVREEVPQNPVALIFDTDAILQILLVDRMDLLHSFKKQFQIQPAVVEAVEVEVRKNKKFSGKVIKNFQKALDSGTLCVLDVPSMSGMVTTDPRSAYDSIQTRGSEMNLVLDYGEAYTYAAGLVLKSPVVSNDMRAIRAATNARFTVPRFILRVFDFIVVCHHIGEIDGRGCDEIRKVLIGLREWVPLAFQHSSFGDGLSYFYARLLERARAPIGAAQPTSALDLRLEISVIRRSDRT